MEKITRDLINVVLKGRWSLIKVVSQRRDYCITYVKALKHVFIVQANDLMLPL